MITIRNIQSLHKHFNNKFIAYNDNFEVFTYHRFQIGRCLMSAKSKYFFTFSSSKRTSNLYIKDIDFINNYLKIIEKVTNTNIEYTILKTKIIFNVSLKEKDLNKNYYNVYRAVVLTRFLTLKQFWLYPLAIVELSKYLESTEEVLYLTNLIYPTNHYWGLYQSFKRYNTRFDLSFRHPRLKFNFDNFKSNQNNVMNDFFNYEFKDFDDSDEYANYRLHYYLIEGNFKEAAEYYLSFKNKL